MKVEPWLSSQGNFPRFDAGQVEDAVNQVKQVVRLTRYFGWSMNPLLKASC